MNSRRTISAIATIAAVAAMSAIAFPAHAQTYYRYPYGAPFVGAYGYMPEYAPPSRVYGAEHYYRRPYQSDVNPDFQLGGNR